MTTETESAGEGDAPWPREESQRPTAELIYRRVKEDAEEELRRPRLALAFSGLFGGFTVSAGPLAAAIALALLGDGSAERFVAFLLYPVGFVAVVLGRAQLFTENTLYPVALSLEDRRHFGPTARLWAVVFAANLAGALLFALLTVTTSAMPLDVQHELGRLGVEASAGTFAKVLWSGVVAGWLLALVAWLVEAGETAIGQFAVIWPLTLLVGLGSFDHSVVSAVYVFAATIDGLATVGDAASWLVAATLGNVVGGVLIVTLLNYGQVRPKRGEA